VRAIVGVAEHQGYRRHLFGSVCGRPDKKGIKIA
jgi:hypothetical protein